LCHLTDSVCGRTADLAFPARRSSDLLVRLPGQFVRPRGSAAGAGRGEPGGELLGRAELVPRIGPGLGGVGGEDRRRPVLRSRTPDRKSTRLNSQSRENLVCRLLLEKK